MKKSFEKGRSILHTSHQTLAICKELLMKQALRTSSVHKNTGDASMSGLELDLVYMLMDDLVLNFNLGTLECEI